MKIRQPPLTSIYGKNELHFKNAKSILLQRLFKAKQATENRILHMLDVRTMKCMPKYMNFSIASMNARRLIACFRRHCTDDILSILAVVTVRLLFISRCWSTLCSTPSNVEYSFPWTFNMALSNIAFQSITFFSSLRSLHVRHWSRTFFEKSFYVAEVVVSGCGSTVLQLRSVKRVRGLSTPLFSSWLRCISNL